MYQLRNYQVEAVRAIIHYFRNHSLPAVAVLPTGAGKSLVIAELARLAKGRVLVLAHVKELVEQNHEKYQSYGLTAGIYSAGIGRKESESKVIFASVQSVANNLEVFKQVFSLVIIDECHRVSLDENTSYQKVIQHLQAQTKQLKVLGFTATPYRLDSGWIYQFHSAGRVRSDAPRFFHQCVFELPIHYLLDEGFLTPAKRLDALQLGYDFSALKPSSGGHYPEIQLNKVIESSKRATPEIIKQIIAFAHDKQGVLIFAATTRHAQEIYALLPVAQTAVVLGDTPQSRRDEIINDYKQKKIKYLVNVAVLTTGFDAPHIDLIAILRPTESVSLYQQIVGRGLRLSDNKKQCLILDYAGNDFDLYQPEVGEPKPAADSDIVTVPCPACGYNNNFWGRVDNNGFVLEHYGRRCQGFFIDEANQKEICGYRFRAKFCPQCGADNDIAARICLQCEQTLVDPDKKLREALQLKNVMILYCSEMQLKANTQDKPQLQISYLDANGAKLTETWQLATLRQKRAFLAKFIPAHLIDRHRKFTDTAPTKIVQQQHRLRFPDVVIAKKSGRFWQIKDKLFDLTVPEQK